MIPPIGIGPLGVGEWGVGGVSPLGAGSQVDAAPGATSSSGGFGGALTSAIDSLDQSQAAGASAAQALATGKLTDPTAAVTAVENASLEMQFASQLRTKLVDATTSIFGTSM